MAEIPSLPSPAAPALATPTAAMAAMALPLGEVGLESLPQRLSQLSRPVVITGTVVGQTSDGATRVRTQAGEVVMRTAPPLPTDAPVILQIGAGQPPTRASAFINTQLGANFASVNLAALPSLVAEEPAPRPGPAGQVPISPAQESEAQPPPPGTVVPAQMLSAPGRMAAPLAALGQAALSSAPGAAPSFSGQTPLPVRGFLSSEPLALRILAAPGAAATVLASAVAESGAELSGTIAGSTASGQPILATPLGNLALAIKGPLPLGLKLSVEVVDPRQLVFSHPLAGSDAAPTHWPALSQILTSLGGLEGALAQALLGSVVPQPNKKLAAALSFFIDAIRRGSARDWLGAEAVKALEQAGQSDALDRLSDEFCAQSREPARGTNAEWQALSLPLFDGTGLQRLALFIKSHRGDEDGSSSGKAGGERNQRFVLDLELSRLGALQLDGLVKAKSRHFDLIVRSRDPLPDPLRAELIEVFSSSLEAVGYAGGLAFQPGARGWIKLTAMTAPRPGQGFIA